MTTTTTITATASAEIYSDRVSSALEDAKLIEQNLRKCYDGYEDIRRSPEVNPWAEDLGRAVALEDFLKDLLEREYAREGS